MSSIILSLLLSLVDNTFKSLTNYPYSVLTLIREIFRGMFAAPLEEFVFRGFLWGYLLKIGISMKKAMWIQIVMFWSSHIFEIGNIPFFMITLPIGTYFFSYLRKQSNNLSPSIMSHLLFNTIRSIVYY
jgi:membrane protease YdiL (CAAX protease family)